MAASALRLGIDADLGLGGVPKNGRLAAAPKPAFRTTAAVRLPWRTRASRFVAWQHARRSGPGLWPGASAKACDPAVPSSSTRAMRDRGERPSPGPANSIPKKMATMQRPAEGEEEVAPAPGEQTQVVRGEGQDGVHRR